MKARVARVALAGCGLLAVAACTQEAGPAAPTVPVTAPAVPVTTPSTTSAPTTTLSPQQQDEEEIRLLHGRFYGMIMASADPPDPDHPELAATTTGIQRQRSYEANRSMLEQGQHMEGTFEGRVRAIRFLDADHAAVDDCVLSTVFLLGREGEVVIGHAERAHVTEVRVVRAADGWLVEDWFTGGEIPCEW